MDTIAAEVTMSKKVFLPLVIGVYFDWKEPAPSKTFFRLEEVTELERNRIKCQELRQLSEMFCLSCQLGSIQE